MGESRQKANSEVVKAATSALMKTISEHTTTEEEADAMLELVLAELYCYTSEGP